MGVGPSSIAVEPCPQAPRKFPPLPPLPPQLNFIRESHWMMFERLFLINSNMSAVCQIFIVLPALNMVASKLMTGRIMG